MKLHALNCNSGSHQAKAALTVWGCDLSTRNLNANINKYGTTKTSCIEQSTAGRRNVSPQFYMVPVASSMSILEAIKDANMVKPQF